MLHWLSAKRPSRRILGDREREPIEASTGLSSPPAPTFRKLLLMRPLIFLALTAALASPIAASDPDLGVEIPVSREIAAAGGAPYSQTRPSLASNGRSSLLLWIDQRSSLGSYAPLAVYLTHLDAEGRPTEPFGRQFAPMGVSVAIASNGVDYVVVLVNQYGIWSFHLDEKGRALGQPRQLAPFQYAHTVLSMVWNGTNYVLIQSGFVEPVIATFLDVTGDPVASVQLSATGDVGALFSHGAGCQVVLRPGPCPTCAPGEIRLLSVNPTGIFRDRLLTAIPYPTNIAAAALGDRILLATLSNRENGGPGKISVDVLISDRDGNLESQSHLADAASPYGVNQIYKISVFPDRDQWVVTWQQPTTTSAIQSFAMHLDHAGKLLDTAPILTNLAGALPLLAILPGGPLLVWSSGDIVAQPARDFLTGQGTVLSLSAPSQSDLRLVGLPSATLAVWRESGSGRQIRSGLVGGSSKTLSSGIDPGPPGAAASANVALVAWVESATAGIVLRLTRIGLDGAPVEESPLSLAAFGNPTGVAGRPAVASDGSGFVVAWSTGTRLETIGLSGSGTLLSHQSIPASGSPKYSVTATWTGNDYLITWREDGAFGGGFPVLGPTASFLYRIRADRSGRALDSSATLINRDEGGISTSSSAVSFGPGIVAIASTASRSSADHHSCVYVLTTTPDATVITNAREVYCASALDTYLRDVAIEWNGTDFVVAWTESKEWTYFLTPSIEVKALRIDAEARPRDISAIRLSSQFDLAEQPAIARSGNGAIVGYSRQAGDLYGNVARAFARTFAPFREPSRRRVVRR